MKTIPLIFTLISISISQNKPSLISAWENDVKNNKDVVLFEKIKDSLYNINDSSIGYSGPLKIKTLLIQKAHSKQLPYEYFGTVIFSIDSLVEKNLKETRAFYSWQSQFNTFMFKNGKWKSGNEVMEDQTGFPSYFWSNWYLWIILAFISYSFIITPILNRRHKKYIDKSDKFIEKSEKLNLETSDRAEKMMKRSDENIELVKELLKSSQETNQLLRELINKIEK